MYTVHELAEAAGVTVRTLHYYDEIGLLAPAHLAKNGYRYYDEPQKIKLQQILFFRELDFALADIKRIMDRPGFGVVEALRDQKKLIIKKRTRLDGLIKSIDNTIKSMTNNSPISDNELYDAFNDDDIKAYQNEVKQRWGKTDAYKQSMARVSKMTKAEMQKLKDDGKAFTKLLANAMSKNIKSAEVQALIQKHYEGVCFFYDCPISMYRNLGQMYVDDPRFTAYYDKVRPGLAVFVRDAIAFYCDQKEKGQRDA